MNSKSILAPFLAAASALCLFALPLSADTFGLFTYTDNGTSITIDRYPVDAVGAVVIPATIIGKPVTSIGWAAFEYCSGLTSVTIPNSVTSIEGGAFWDCTGLTSVSIPNSVTSIGAKTFEGCRGLTSVSIPNSVTSLGDDAFSLCTGLTSVSIPNSITSIGRGAFYGCSGLTSVSIPYSVTSIGYHAFSGCTGLTAITVDALNTDYSSINGVLFDKSKIELIQYPGGKTGSYSIPNGVSWIGDGAFSRCTGLTSVSIHNSVSDIGEYAFSGCTSLTSVSIPNSYISDYAFQYCTGLTSVSIGTGVSNIGDYAFSKCTGLTSVSIGSNVAWIRKNAFEFCTGLTSVSIPNSVESIGYQVFLGCSGLTSAVFLDNAPSMGEEVFYGTASGFTVYYQSGSTPFTTPTWLGYPCVAMAPNTFTVNYPNGGENIYFGSAQTVTWRSNTAGNVEIDLYKGGVLNTVLSASESNDGSYSWVVSSGLPAGNDYAIKISSVTNPAYTDSSNTAFSIMRNPIGDALDNPGLPWTPGGAANWFAQGATTHDGVDAAQSGAIANNQSSSLETTLTGPGTLTFWWKVSSESDCDYLRFFLDGVEQTGNLGEISGTVDWIKKTVSIPAGSHTAKWAYTKDSSSSSGSDAGWVDQVSFVPDVPEAPIVTTAIASGITATTATLNGSVNPHGFTTTAQFEYGLTASYGSTVSVTLSPDKGTDVQNVSTGISGLQPGQTYHYRLAASNGVGTGTGSDKIFTTLMPEIAVQQPAGTDLKDGVSSKSFGSVAVKSAVTKTFTIRNAGTANLTNLAVTKTGVNAKDFTVKSLLKTSLAPGASTTFKVVFKPSVKGTRKADIHIKSNDSNENPFDIALTGKGIALKAAPSALASAARLPSWSASGGSAWLTHDIRQTSGTVQLADGRRYLTLTVIKSPEYFLPTRSVEVSPNLIDWYSGSKHTTVITDDASLLKVRDNTPLTPETKRYIRLNQIGQ